MRRREFIALPRQALGGVLLYSLSREPVRLEAQEGAIRVPLRFFTTVEAEIVVAASERIFPGDESGPGATEAGVVIYIDRQLAGPYRRDRYRYTKPPFVESVVEHGYQGGASPRDIYRQGLQGLKEFTTLTAVEQDNRLKSIERTLFFRLLRTHTIEGMFCDPMHGGNAGLIGWQLVGFPGSRMDYREQIDQHFGLPWRPKPLSLQQIVGHPVKGWEDELEEPQPQPTGLIPAPRTPGQK
jgi:gluconate 2-dehydrogenase gamma chain